MDILTLSALAAALGLAPAAIRRIRLSRAKHPSLAGHARISRRLARLVPHYEYEGETRWNCDGAPDEVARLRHEAFIALGRELDERAPRTLETSRRLEARISDLQFTSANRVPFQFRGLVEQHFGQGALAKGSEGVRLCDLDDNWSWDISGSYGVNLLGQDFYKHSIAQAVSEAGALGPVLGPYHPVIEDNVSRLCKISGLDEVSFHMSGTEAVMQAVRLARFHTRRKRLVMFCGAYHGWWDGVQPGVGNRRAPHDIFMLRDASKRTLKVLETRRDIACVLINPLQALHPNSGAASDAMLIAERKKTQCDREAYSEWLQSLREVCTRRGIILIMDEVFLGFRLGLGGAQEYFGVRADMVTYGKTLGGGLPVGALCGRADLMKRYRAGQPTDLCFARGTFNSHPYVMTAMNAFLRHVTDTGFVSESLRWESTWDQRFAALNQRFQQDDLPLRICNLSSVATVAYTTPGRYHWMYQFYLRAEGVNLGWIGTGRLIFSHNYSDTDFSEVADRMIAAARKMRDDGWWWHDGTTTAKDIKRQVMGEILARKLGRNPKAAS